MKVTVVETLIRTHVVEVDEDCREFAQVVKDAAENVKQMAAPPECSAIARTVVDVSDNEGHLLVAQAAGTFQFTPQGKEKFQQ